MIEFFKTEKPITEKEINNIEELLVCTFPSDYKNHILKHNGGKCKPNVFSFIENDKKSKSNIDWFLAIYNGKYDNLISYINIYKIEQKRLPKSLIPIAHDPGGNLICISCCEPDYGFIYFWDHEKEGNNEQDDYKENLFLIAKSFNKFINNLTLE